MNPFAADRLQWTALHAAKPVSWSADISFTLDVLNHCILHLTDCVLNYCKPVNYMSFPAAALPGWV